MQTFINRCREWQKKNPDWELVCDFLDTDRLYKQWPDLSKTERMHWIGKYKDRAREAFEEFGLKKCKVESKVLDLNMKLHSIVDWPCGDAMQVFKTKSNGVSLI